jgi:hypothetical protein
LTPPFHENKDPLPLAVSFARCLPRDTDRPIRRHKDSCNLRERSLVEDSLAAE